MLCDGSFRLVEYGNAGVEKLKCLRKLNFVDVDCMELESY